MQNKKIANGTDQEPRSTETEEWKIGANKSRRFEWKTEQEDNNRDSRYQPTTRNRRRRKRELVWRSHATKKWKVRKECEVLNVHRLNPVTRTY